MNCAYYLFFTYVLPTANPGFSFDLMISLLVFATIVFRVELAVLIGAICLQLLLSKRQIFKRMMKAGAISGLVSLGTMVAPSVPLTWATYVRR